MKYRLILVVSILFLIFAFGCKKKDEEKSDVKVDAAAIEQAADTKDADDAKVDDAKADAPPSVVAKAAPQLAETQDVMIMGDIFDDDINVSNSLLSYIPDNSLMLYASTQAISADDPRLSRLMRSYRKLFESINENDVLAIYESLGEDLTGINLKDGMKYIIDELFPLLKDYKPEALEAFGYDPTAKVDSIAYFNGTELVFKQNGIKDATKMLNWLSMLVEKFDLKSTDEDVNGKAWKTFDLAQVGVLGIHVEGNVSTVVVCINATKEASYAASLLAAETPYSIEKLKKHAAKGSVIGVGLVDNIKLADYILNEGSKLYALIEGIDPEFEKPKLSKVCIDEMTDLAKAMPSFITRFYLKEHSPKNISLGVRSILSISDTAMLKSLQGLQRDIPNAGIHPDAALASLSAGLDLVDTFEWLKGFGEKFESAPYKCEYLEELNEFSELKDVKLFEDMGIDAKINVTSLLMLLENIDTAPNGDPINFKGRAAVLGEQLSALAKAIAKEEPKLADGISFEHNVKSTMSLKDVIPVYKDLNLVFTESGAFASISDVDVIQLANLGTQKWVDVVGISVNMKILKAIYGNDIPKEFASVSFMKSIYYGIGVSSEGIHLNMFMNLE